MIEELSLLLESYEDRGIKSREYYFLRDMEYNLKKERNISDGQRDWLERILKRGAPQLVDRDSLAKIESLIDMERISFSKKKVLSNLRSQVYSGKTLTEKQKLLIEQIEMQLISLKNFKKNSDTIRDMKFIVQLSKSRPPSWWRLRPKQHQALSEVCEWIDWNESKCFSKEPELDENSYNYLKKTFKRQLAVLKESPHPEGSMRLIKIGSEYLPAVVLGQPHVSKAGKVLHPVLVNGISRDASKLFKPQNVKNNH